MSSRLQDAPIGTKAPSIDGEGHWSRTEKGWTWVGPSGTGAASHMPGAAWTGDLIYPPECTDLSDKIWHPCGGRFGWGDDIDAPKALAFLKEIEMACRRHGFDLQILRGEDNGDERLSIEQLAEGASPSIRRLAVLGQSVPPD